MSQMMHDKIKPGQVYRHYKGTEYRIIALGIHSEKEEEMVAYESVKDKHVYFRPLDLFFNEVEWEGKTVTRFVLVSE